MPTTSWGRATRAGVGWSLASLVGGRTLTFLATLVLARLLVPAEFGVVAAILVFLALLELASDLGMKATVIYEQERGRSYRLDSAFTINLLIAILLFAFALALAPAVAGFFGVGAEAGLFRLAAPLLLLSAFGNIHDALLMRELDFRRRIVPELIRGVVRGAVSVALAFAGAGAGALVIGMLVGQGAWVAALWFQTGYRPRLRLDLATARSMSAYGSGAVALELIAVIASRADAIVIGGVLGTAALGLYTVAMRVPELLIRSVAWSFSRVAFPALSRRRADDREALPQATLGLLRYQSLVALPAAAWLAVLAPVMIVVLFGETWREGGGVMAAIAVSAGIGSLAYPLGDALKALARQRRLVAINLATVPLVIAAMIAVAPSGIVWVAWAVCALSIVNLLSIAAAVSSLLSIGPARLARALGPALSAGAGCAIGAALVRLAWPAESVGPLLAGSCASLAVGLAALRVLAPATFVELVRALPGRRARSWRERRVAGLRARLLSVAARAVTRP